MFARRKWVAGLVAIAVVVGVLVVFPREREPSYGGKRLSEWLLQEVNSDWSPPIAGPYSPEFEAAIRHIGTSAGPHLLKWMHYEESPWKTKIYQTVNPMLGRVRYTWHLNEWREQSLKTGALYAFMTLGRGAERVLPELTRALNNTHAPNTAEHAGFVLANLGERGLPPLISVLTNNQSPVSLSNSVVLAFVIRGTNNSPARWALEGLLSAADGYSREVATNVLRELDPQAVEKGGGR